MTDLDFSNIEIIKKSGFSGFTSISDLKENECENVSDLQGVYLVIYPFDTRPEFLKNSNGGYFKGKDPTVSKEILENNWVENSKVIYIGKAGGENNANLQSRIWCYMRFGQGEPVGHWGGRFIWQIEDSDALQICWKPTPNESPSEIETNLILKFENQFGRLPFANLRH